MKEQCIGYINQTVPNYIAEQGDVATSMKEQSFDCIWECLCDKHRPDRAE